MAVAPRASVVVATRNRASRLAALLASLRRQTLPVSQFEVIAVDDCSTDATPAVLGREQEAGVLDLRAIRRTARGGSAAARNDGWCAARAPLVAFTDDDCVADRRWLERAVEAWQRNPGAVIQGRTDPIPEELDGPGLVYSHTLAIHSLGPFYETCNVFYPRELLERLAGFDSRSFPGWGGEDTDLAWRAIEAGAPTEFCDGARVYHAVARLGPLGKLRHAARWTPAVQVYRRHPGVRQHLTAGVFFKGSHYLLFRVIVAAILPRRLWPIRRWLALAYFVDLRRRGRREGGTILDGPYFLVHDLVEFAAIARGAIRYRTLVL